MQAAQRHPDVGQEKSDADQGQDFAGFPQVRIEIGQGTLGCLQVSACILGKPQERGGLDVPDLVIFGGEFERLLGILYGAGNIAKRQGAVGPGGGDRSGQRAKLFFIHNDHLVRRACPASVRRPARRASLASSSPPSSNAQA